MAMNMEGDELGPVNLDCPFLSRTKRLGLRLNDGGYTYFRERCRGDVTYWRCTNKRCKGRIVQKWQSVTRTQGHRHTPSGLPCDPSDSFVANVRLSGHPNNKTLLRMESPDISSVMCDDAPSPPGMNYPVPMLVWEKGEDVVENEDVVEVVEEEQIDVKPDIHELERSLIQPSDDRGVSADPDNMLAENIWLKMKVQKLEMELQRYKDTVSRIRADLDILNMV
ncbi:uncharacterized protein LOC124118601 [Haliotis rufescens]|uniref:uncharacterized protein LOC124118601 n=1 Tax=Haliotis rufescens TaxID=6454 RepID=UPI001EAFE9EA|nr:uncharacterized protein LOC124118601 [Haliotis rufescens]